jgi:predicted transglutaminase-like cysteine proteinase
MVSRVRRPALAGLLAVAGLTLAAVSPANAEQPSIAVSGLTNPPVGHLAFCRTFPGECTVHGSEAAETLTQARWRELQEVNTFINHSVIPATDLDYYQSEEVWTIPETHGDCEDYVLLKRQWLIERGWPTGSLLVTVVFDEVGDGHAVLMVRTSSGDFVLDNKTDEISFWYETAYRFVKRQSVSDPTRWVSVGDPRWTAHSTAASR